MENSNITDGQSEGRADRVFAIVPEWVIYSEISHGALRLYAVLARHTNNETYTAWPSRKTMAEKMRVSTDSIDRFIKELVCAEALSVERRKVETKEGKLRNQSNLYTLGVAAPVRPPKDLGSRKDAAKGGRKDAARGSRTDAAQNYSHIELEPIELENSANEFFPAVIGSEIEVVDDKQLVKEMFDEFWNAYDHKKDRQGALAQWNKQIKDRAMAEMVIAKAREYNAATDPGYLKLPSGWLRGKRWEDEVVGNRKMSAAEKSRAGLRQIALERGLLDD